MGGLGHYLEQEGIATTQISLIREHTEKILPPRALWVPFELGRPLGAPGDAAFQHKVLKAALGLLEARNGPVLADFPEDAPAPPADLAGWACPIPPAAGENEPPAPADPARALLREIDFLRPWYDRALEARGRTTVGPSGMDIPAAARFLSAFLDDPHTPSPIPGRPPGDAVKLASEDLKAYYHEAAAAQPGCTGSRQTADWFWGQTAAGRLLLNLKAACLKSGDPAIKILGTLLLVPRSQAHRAP